MGFVLPKKIPTFSAKKIFFKENVILVGSWKVELDFRVLAPTSMYMLSVLELNSVYGRFHRGREMTTSEMEFFCFAVKTLKGWIYFQTFCN